MMSSSILIVGALAGLVVIVVLALLFRKGNVVDLTTPTETKPDWMRQNPPAETVAATLADGKGVQVFDHDEGERLAAPFAEQIEDIIQARLTEHPELSKYKLDFGTAPEGGLEIYVNGERYLAVDELPEDGLRALVKEAIAIWQKTN